jgi:5-methylcytosine-specific restriction endonuclease McrA
MSFKDRKTEAAKASERRRRERQKAEMHAGQRGFFAKPTTPQMQKRVPTALEIDLEDKRRVRLQERRRKRRERKDEEFRIIWINDKNACPECLRAEKIVKFNSLEELYQHYWKAHDEPSNTPCHEIKRLWFEANGPCVKCGSSANLEIDHILPITKDRLVSNEWGIWRAPSVLRDIELAKCQVLCKSCHQVKTIAENIKMTLLQMEIEKVVETFAQKIDPKCPVSLKNLLRYRLGQVFNDALRESLDGRRVLLLGWKRSQE